MDSIKQFEQWKNIIDQMNLSEAACPFYRGKLLTEDNEVVSYNKIHRLLNTPQFEKAHAFLYSLDPTELSESEATKLNNLWKLGCEKGYVKEEDEEVEANECDTQDVKENDILQNRNHNAHIPECDALMPKQMPAVPVQDPTKPVKLPCNSCDAFTILYSAMRNGKITTGEAYSNCLDTRTAKQDILGKLQKAGYQNISILAIEAGDPDSRGMEDDIYNKAEDLGAIPDYSLDVPEADDRDPISHSLDPIGVKASTANSIGKDTVAMSGIEDDLTFEADDEEGKEEESSDDSTEDTSTEDDSGSDEESTDDSGSEEDSSSEEGSEDTGSEDEGSEEDASDEEPADEEGGDEGSEEEESPEEDVEEPDEKAKDNADEDSEGEDSEEEEDKELTAQEKETLKNSYRKTFKSVLKKLKFEVPFNELSLEQKIDFFTEIDKVWDKEDPTKFMTQKEQEQLEAIKVAPDKK